MLSPEFLDLLNDYGPLLIFLIIFLEGLNLTGIPAIVILPTIGFFILNTSYSFIFIFLITVVAATLGNLTYYFIAYKFGSQIYDFFYKKFPATQKSLNAASRISHKYGPLACLVGRILPAARTFVSLVSGVFKVKFSDFFIYSIIGISIWNVTLLAIGYFLSSIG